MNTRPPRIPRGEPADMEWQWSLLAVLLICVALTAAGVWLSFKVAVWAMGVVSWWWGG